MTVRSGLRCALLLFSAIAVSPRAVHAQGEPTPFWISDPPAGKDTAEPAKKKSKPAKPAKPAQPKSTSAFQDDDEAPPPPKHKAPPAPKPVKAEPVKKKKPAPADDDVPAPKLPTKPRYEPLPPLPHLEPSAPPQQAAPAYPPPAQPAPSPYYQQPYRPPAAPAPPPQPRYAPAPQQEVVVPIDERGTASDPSTDAYKQAHPLPPPPQQGYAPPQAQPRQLPPLRPDLRTYSQPPPDEQIDDTQPQRLRRISLEALVGVWSKATSDAQTRDWQIAYGLDFGVAFARWLALDVRAVRSSGTDGTATVNATTSHLLFDGRLTFAVNFRNDKLAVFAGGGGGLVLEKTQLFLQDAGTDPTTLSSSGLEGVGEAVIGGRWRPWKGFTLRLEVDGILRQGALEPIFLLGAGWAF